MKPLFNKFAGGFVNRRGASTAIFIWKSTIFGGGGTLQSYRKAESDLLNPLLRLFTPIERALEDKIIDELGIWARISPAVPAIRQVQDMLNENNLIL
jgi:hypothetical protein